MIRHALHLRRPTGTTLAVVVFLALVGAVAPSPAAAQSSLADRGLGLPIAPLDARAAGWGGVAVGLPSGQLNVADPASVADLTIPAVTFSFQHTWADAEAGERAETYGGTRFPLIAVSYPSSLGVFFLTFGSVLDQRWNASETKLITLQGTSSQARVTDEFVSEGGISAVRLGFARRLGSSVSVAVQGGRNLGDISRVFTRSFDSLEVESSVPPFQNGGQWKYRGWTAGVGLGVDVAGFARLAGAWNWSGEVEAQPTSTTDGGARDYAFPTELRLGASAVLSTGLVAAAGVTRTAWSGVSDDLNSALAGDALEWGGGLEWQGLSVLGKPSALRLGYRAGDLPFHNPGEDQGSESAFTSGLGIDLLASETVLLAQLDFSLERGTREVGDLSENFWRLGTSIRVSGF